MRWQRSPIGASAAGWMWDAACFLLCITMRSEILTGDMPTPVKYYNPAIRDAYKQVEAVAADKLLSMLPEDLQDEYRPLFGETADMEHRLVKAADKLSALIKCVEEERMGNREFAKARQATFDAVRALGLPAADCFLDEFLPAYELTQTNRSKKRMPCGGVLINC